MACHVALPHPVNVMSAAMASSLKEVIVCFLLLESKSKPFSFFRQLLLNLQAVPEMAYVLKPELWQIIISLRSRTRKI